MPQSEVVQVAYQELERRRLLAAGIARSEGIARQHTRGLLTPHERLEILLDPGSKMQLGALAHSDDLAEADKTMGGDGSVFGFGTIQGRVVAFHANDPTVKGASGGTAGKRLRDKQQRFMEHFRVPVFELAQ